MENNHYVNIFNYISFILVLYRRYINVCDSDVLLEKVPGGSGSVGSGIVLERVMLVTAKIEHNLKSITSPAL